MSSVAAMALASLGSILALLVLVLGGLTYGGLVWWTSSRTQELSAPLPEVGSMAEGPELLEAPVVPMDLEPSAPEDPAPAPAARRTAAPPRPEPPPVSGVTSPLTSPLTVRLASLPPAAHLEIDGQSRGRAPAKLDLLPGPHEVVARSGDDTIAVILDVSERAPQWCLDLAAGSAVQGRCDVAGGL